MRVGLVSAAAVVGVASLTLAACERAPLPFVAADAGVIDTASPSDAGGAGDGGGGDGGADAARVVPAVDWAISVGGQVSPSVPGATELSGVAPLDDRGAIVAGNLKGTVAFAADRVMVAGPRGSGFVARYRRDQR